MNLTQIKQVLDSSRIQLTKSLGQNFLHDRQQLGRIVTAAELSNQDRVLEIGPGLGALTQLLVERSPQVTAVEKDQRLFDYLQRRFADQPHLTLIHADALQMLQEKEEDWSEWKLVSNLPYSVASPILVELANRTGAPTRMVVTLQREVAQRIVSKADDDEYGVLSLLLQLRFEPGEMFNIPAECFFPVPDVESACLTLRRRPAELLARALHPAFFKIVKRSFSQRRKMMMKLMKADWPLPRLAAAFEQARIHPQARAETVTLEQYVILTNLLTQPTALAHE